MALSIDDMDDSAVIANEASPAETPHPHVIRVIAGEFAAGSDYSTWREQGTADWLLIHTIAGVGRVAGPAGDVITAAGDSVLLRPHLRHDYGTAEVSWTLAYAHFHARAEWAPLLDWPSEVEESGSCTLRARCDSAFWAGCDHALHSRQDRCRSRSCWR